MLKDNQKFVELTSGFAEEGLRLEIEYEITPPGRQLILASIYAMDEATGKHIDDFVVIAAGTNLWTYYQPPTTVDAQGSGSWARKEAAFVRRGHMCFEDHDAKQLDAALGTIYRALSSNLKTPQLLNPRELLTGVVNARKQHGSWKPEECKDA